MNWDRGLKRITFVLSVIGAIVGVVTSTGSLEKLLGAFFGFGIVWGSMSVICAIIMWINSGFSEDKQKNEQKAN